MFGKHQTKQKRARLLAPSLSWVKLSAKLSASTASSICKMDFWSKYARDWSKNLRKNQKRRNIIFQNFSTNKFFPNINFSLHKHFFEQAKKCLRSCVEWSTKTHSARQMFAKQIDRLYSEHKQTPSSRQFDHDNAENRLCEMFFVWQTPSMTAP
jgi:hypothetical protein